MRAALDRLDAGIEAFGCLTALGSETQTLAALLAGKVALSPCPVLGKDGGDAVPLALLSGLDDTMPPRWLTLLAPLASRLPQAPWGSASHPVYLTSSNYGVGTLYAYSQTHEAGRLAYGTTGGCIRALREAFDWGPNVTAVSHACVSAHLGLAQASRALQAPGVEQALVFTFDFLSPFVTGGFHSLKILNSGMPAPFAAGAIGSIGLGDGAGFAVLSKRRTPLRLTAHVTYNEMHHVTSNRPDGDGFTQMAKALLEVAPPKVWIKGHGTGTLEAGRLEAQTMAAHFPDSPLVSWKGSLGHTLGSCGLVELAIAAAALDHGTIPGTVGTSGPTFSPQVALSPFHASGFDAAILGSNAFGGAHAAALLIHD